MPGKPKKLVLERPDMRDHVLKAALLAIEEIGPAKVRVQDIADRAGMSTGHVLYYFGRRDRVIIETLLMSEQELTRDRDAELALIDDPRAAVTRFVEIYLPDHPNDIRWRLWTQVYAHPPEDPPTLAKITSILATWQEALSSAIRQGIAQGAFTEVDDPGFLAMRICRFMDGLATDLMIGLPGHDTPWAVDLTLKALWRELLP